MANAILNFHFDFLTPSLILTVMFCIKNVVRYLFRTSSVLRYMRLSNFFFVQLEDNSSNAVTFTGGVAADGVWKRQKICNITTKMLARSWETFYQNWVWWLPCLVHSLTDSCRWDLNKATLACWSKGGYAVLVADPQIVLASVFTLCGWNWL